MKNKKQKNTRQPMAIQKSTDFIYVYERGISTWLYFDQDDKLNIVETDDVEMMNKIAVSKNWMFIAEVKIQSKVGKRVNFEILVPRYEDESEEESINKFNVLQDYLKDYSSGVSMNFIFSGKQMLIDLQG